MNETTWIKWIEELLLNDENNFYEIKHCPACNCESKKYFSVEKFDFLRCSNCGTIFEKQRPTEIGAHKLYNSIFSDYCRNKIEIPSFFSNTVEKYSMSKQNLEKLRKQLFSFINEKNLTLLDFASGLGVIADYYQKSGKFKAVYCYEINKNSIAFIKHNFNNLKFYKSGCQVDVVIMYAALEHFSDPHKILKEIYNTLKPGGIIQIFIPFMGVLTRKYFPSMYSMLGPGSHINFFTAKGMKELSQRLNFELLNIKYLSYDSQYLIKFIYANEAFMTYKFVYNDNLKLDNVVAGYMWQNKFYDFSRFGNFFIRNFSRILNKMKLNFFLKLLDQGTCMSVILRK